MCSSLLPHPLTRAHGTCLCSSNAKLLVLVSFSSPSLLIAGRPKKLLVLVNPFGGRKSALKIFAADVKPLLDDANILFTMQGWLQSFYS